MSTPLATLVDARAIVHLQDARVRLWHESPPEPAGDGSLAALIEAQHAANFTLWHAEDEARRSLYTAMTRATEELVMSRPAATGWLRR